MMALANLLENPIIRKERMSGPIEGRQIKRSNKDLGRVLAIAELTTEQEIIRWPDKWLLALQVCFPSHWRFFASTTASGIRQLLKSDEDLEEAWYTCVNGLLAAGELHRTMEQLRLTGERLLAL